MYNFEDDLQINKVTVNSLEFVFFSTSHRVAKNCGTSISEKRPQACISRLAHHSPYKNRRKFLSSAYIHKSSIIFIIFIFSNTLVQIPRLCAISYLFFVCFILCSGRFAIRRIAIPICTGLYYPIRRRTTSKYLYGRNNVLKWTMAPTRQVTPIYHYRRYHYQGYQQKSNKN